LHHKNLNSKNLSHREDTFATSIRSITEIHCELNFIEQYWGASKYCYRSTARTTNIAEMETNVLASLDDVPLLQIRRCVSFFSFYPHCSY
jgi:hypothetical protein